VVFETFALSTDVFMFGLAGAEEGRRTVLIDTTLIGE